MENVNPFMRCSKTARSPERTTSPRVDKSVTGSLEGGDKQTMDSGSPVKQRETLSESLFLPAFASPANGDALTMLGAKIEELAKMMVLQRHVNQQMRGVVSSISALHKKVKQEQNKLATHNKAKSGVEKATQTPFAENAKANGKRTRAQYRGNSSPENSPQPIGKRTRSISLSVQASHLEGTCKQGTNDRLPRGNKPTSNENEGWVEVRRAKRRTTPTQTLAAAESRSGGTFSEIVRQGGEKQRIRARPDAFIISNKGEGSYADILRVIKSEPSLSQLGDMVTKIRKTQKGEMLFQLKTRGEADNAQYQGLVEKVLGDKAEVRVLTHELTIECRDLDEVGGPRSSKRRLLSSVIACTLLYAAPVWAKSLKVKAYRRPYEAMYRLCALRVISAYKTTSDEAAMVIAGMIPIDILAEERARVFVQKEQDHSNISAIIKKEKATSMLKWQERWENATKGRWTYTLIPKIEKWLNRSYGEPNFQLTQFLTGHGCYQKYLHRLRIRDSPLCRICHEEEDARHVFFVCPRFVTIREDLASLSDDPIVPENIVDIMMSSKYAWDKISAAISQIIYALKLADISEVSGR